MSTLESGSIEEVVARLFVWSKRAPKGLARAEFTSEFSRQRVVDELRSDLLAENIPLHEIELPLRKPAMEIVQFLVAQLSAIESGIVSISGFPTAFGDDVSLENSLRILNFNRENLARFPLCQIWWMTPNLADAFIHAIPDLNSWFIVRVHLTENIVSPLEARSLENATISSARQEEARRDATDLITRFDNGILAEADLADLIALARSAVDRLKNIGLVKEASESSHYFLEKLVKYPDLEKTSADNSEMPRMLTDLAVLYETLELLDEAETLSKKVVTINKSLLGINHPDTAASLNNLALLYERQGRYAEAEPLYVEALATHMRQLGSDHPSTATVLNNLADLYTSLHQYAKAEPLYLEALAIRKRKLGIAYPDTATSLNNLAELYRIQGRYAEVEPLYLEALDIYRKYLGSAHPNTATILNNLALLYEAQGRYAAAESLYLKALEIDEHALGFDHPDVLVDLENYAALLSRTNRQAEAEQMRTRAEAIRERHAEKNRKAE